MPTIKFIDLADRKISHVIDQTEFYLGRADDCALQVMDPEVSRHQATIKFHQDGYRITNTGQNPVDINGQTVASQKLEDGDLLRAGKNRFLVRVLDTRTASTAQKKKPTQPAKPAQGRPYLVLEDRPGTERFYPIEANQIVIGRSADAQIRFDEKNISRRHCAIETENNGFVAAKLSRTSSVTVNGKEIERCRLKNGDRIALGDHVLRFCHEPRPPKPASPKPTPPESAPANLDATSFAPDDMTWERPPHFLIDTASGNARVFDLKGSLWHIGRDTDCELQLPEKTVSRRHARVAQSDNGFWIENLSRSGKVTINGQEATRRRLWAGDQVQIGPHTLVFISKRAEDVRKEEEAGEDSGGDAEHTIFSDDLPVISLVPRLILDTGTDTARTFHLEKDRMILGRSAEADIRLDDPGISRVHGAIEKIDEGYVAVNLCDQNPLRINQEEVTRQRLFSGDRMQLGATVISFMSDRPEDIRAAAELPPPAPGRGYLALRALAMGLILLLGIYVGYQKIFLPWRDSRVIQRASAAFADGRYTKGEQMVEEALSQELPAEKDRKLRRLLADATLKRLQRLIQAEDNGKAQQLLDAYLSHHGDETDAGVVWREQDRICLKFGETLEKKGDLPGAMAQYARVRAESIHFAAAEKKLSRLWRNTQVTSLLGQRRRALADALVKEGEKHDGPGALSAGGQKAYTAYRTALWLVPDHPLALEKTTAMAKRLKEQGTVLMGMKNWAGALESLYLASLVDPQDSRVLEQLNRCRKELAKNRQKADSDLNKASRSVKQIALSLQQRMTDQSKKMVTALLQKALAAVEGKKDLIPYGQNAYACFLAVLRLDPDNDQALAGIGDLGKRIRKQGIEAFKAGAWEKAQKDLGGSLLVEPGDGQIREMLIDCQKKVMAGRSGQKAAYWFSSYLKGS